MNATTSGKGALADALLPYLTDTGNLPPYRTVAEQLGLTEGATKVAVHRLRQRFGAILRLEIAETVLAPADVDDEVRELIRALSPSVIAWPATDTRWLSGPGGLCPVCLLEQALAPPTVRDLIIQVPLGHGADTSVFLVRQEAPSPALLRLKVWRRPAPAAFLEGVAELTRILEELAEPVIVPPLAACLDATGCPAVLSAFRQGLPMLHAVQSGALTPAVALALLESLASDARPMPHARGSRTARSCPAT